MVEKHEVIHWDQQSQGCNSVNSIVDHNAAGLKESEVRSYSRAFNKRFQKSKDEFLYTVDGEKYLDFFAGAGSLNYGHNNDELKKALITYIESDGITHGLDFDTSVKSDFMNVFSERILQPAGLNYKIQFTSPSGTNANEAAIKLAKKVTGRSTIFSFTGSFHGMSLGSLAATGSNYFRKGLPSSLHDVVFFPYENGFLEGFDSLSYMEAMLNDPSSGVDVPAAIILETLQAEGGVNIASNHWLQGLRELCDRYGILLICDDVQVGCGRTGDFFSFTEAGIVPDMVTLSKSISGYGLPMAVVLLKPEYDQWLPGQHSGTFRGNQHAFVTGAEALKLRDAINLADQVKQKSQIVATMLNESFESYPEIDVRGKGLIWGIDYGVIDRTLAKQISADCFADGLIIECAGRYDEVLKILPPLTISEESLRKGLKKITTITNRVLAPIDYSLRNRIDDRKVA